MNNRRLWKWLSTATTQDEHRWWWWWLYCHLLAISDAFYLYNGVVQSADRWHSPGSDGRHVPHLETAVEWWRHEAIIANRTDRHRRHAMKVTSEANQTRACVHVPHFQRPTIDGCNISDMVSLLGFVKDERPYNTRQTQILTFHLVMVYTSRICGSRVCRV